MRISDWSSDVCSSDLVERDDRPAFGRPVEQFRVPLVHRGAKVREQDKRHPALITEPALGVAGAVRHDEARAGLLVVCARWIQAPITCGTADSGGKGD